MDDSCTPEVLAYSVRMCAEQSQRDHAIFGIDLSYIRNDSANMALELAELSDVIERMPQRKALAMQYFMIGFWNGINKSHRQHEAA